MIRVLRASPIKYPDDNKIGRNRVTRISGRKSLLPSSISSGDLHAAKPTAVARYAAWLRVARVSLSGPNESPRGAGGAERAPN